MKYNNKKIVAYSQKKGHLSSDHIVSLSIKENDGKRIMYINQVPVIYVIFEDETTEFFHIPDNIDQDHIQGNNNYVFSNVKDSHISILSDEGITQVHTGNGDNIAGNVIKRQINFK